MKISPHPYLLLSFSVMLMASTALAHHGWMDFDSTREVTLNATVTDFHFVNPHCVVEFDAAERNGSVQRWQGEFSNPARLTKRGWNAATLAAGDKMVITGHPSKNGTPAMHVSRIQLPDGKTYTVDAGG